VITKIIILGAAGDGRVVADAIRQAQGSGSPVELVGFLDDGRTTAVDDIPVLGGIRDWRLFDSSIGFIAALHKIKKMHSRSQLIDGLDIPKDRWVTFVHPSAIVAKNVDVGEGVFIGQNAVLQPGTYVGRHVSIRAGANLGHDSRCEDFCYVGPNATLCGNAALLRGSHLGPNAVVTDGQSVGSFAVIGAGTVVTKKIPPSELHFGVPARRVGRIPMEGSDVC
jgi:sugar O-acyltransferase (sialic acid O-acetyltransferase NeuD family)